MTAHELARLLLDLPDQEVGANARLITKAPEMLGFLRILADHSETGKNLGDMERANALLREIEEDADEKHI